MNVGVGPGTPRGQPPAHPPMQPDTSLEAFAEAVRADGVLINEDELLALYAYFGGGIRPDIDERAFKRASITAAGRAGIAGSSGPNGYGARGGGLAQAPIDEDAVRERWGKALLRINSWILESSPNRDSVEGENRRRSDSGSSLPPQPSFARRSPGVGR